MGNGYIQVAIPLTNDQTGEITERKQGFKFNAGSLTAYCKIKNIPLNKLEESLDKDSPEFLESVQTLLYVAAKNNQELARKEVDFILADVGEWISSMYQTDLESIIKTFNDSKFLGNGMGASK